MDAQATGFPLEAATPDSLGLDPQRLDVLCAAIARQVARGDYPAAQVAIARRGRLALFRTFGAASDRSLFLMFSNTKVVTAAAVWTLVEDGVLRYGDRIADVLPGFGKHRKGEITLAQLLTHQAGFPSAQIPAEMLEDHVRIREAVCDFVPEWPAGTRVHYHPAAAHWVAAMVIEELTGKDFRAFIRERVTEKLGIADEVMVGVPDASQSRCVDMCDPAAGMAPIAADRDPAARRAGRPGGGGYGTARGMAAFYQALVQGGQLGGRRIVSPRTMAYVARNFTGERMDLNNGAPSHRGMGPYIRGESELGRSIGTLAHPATFGHGGAGSSYCWGDPDSGVSFAFFSSARHAEDVHSARMDALSNIAHSAILD